MPRHGLAVLRHPDQRSSWAIIAVASWKESTLHRDAVAVDRTLLERRLRDLHEVLPIIGARLEGDYWGGGEPPSVKVVEGEPLDEPSLCAPFILAEEAPVRVVLSPERRRLAVVCHHAALDGLGLVAVLRALLGGDVPQAEVSLSEGSVGDQRPRRRELLSRLLRPADVVTPTVISPSHESFASSIVDLEGPDITVRVATACIAAVSRHNRAAGGPWQRIGLSLGIGGRGVGNTATYRRVDLAAGDSVEAAVRSALIDPREPFELVSAPRWLPLTRPLAARMSDSLLVSNVGRQRMPGVCSVEFYPVARGRSALAFGAVGLQGGPSTLSIRARDLSRLDAESLLEDAVTSIR